MDPQEFKNIRLSKNMTQAEFGLWLGYKKGARIRIYEFETGKKAIPPRVELFLIKQISSLF